MRKRQQLKARQHIERETKKSQLQRLGMKGTITQLDGVRRLSVAGVESRRPTAVATSSLQRHGSAELLKKKKSSGNLHREASARMMTAVAATSKGGGQRRATTALARSDTRTEQSDARPSLQRHRSATVHLDTADSAVLAKHLQQ